MVQGEEFRVDGRQVRRLLDGAQLAPFTRLDDRRGLVAPAWTFGLIVLLAAAGAFAWQAGAWWAVLLCLLLLGTQQHALFVLVHEAAHYRLFSTRKANDVVGRLAGTLGGISMCTYRVTHRLHHNHLYGVQDPDIALNGGYPRGRAYLARKLLIDLTGGRDVKDAIGGISFLDALQALADCPDTKVILLVSKPPQDDWHGALFANEVIDALPVTRFVMRDGEVFEEHVIADGVGGFSLCDRPADALVSGAVRHVERDLGVAFADGYRSEILPQLPYWMQAVPGSVPPASTIAASCRSAEAVSPA